MNVTPLDKISNQIPSSGKFLELTSLFLSFFAINFTNWASNFGGYEVIKFTQVPQVQFIILTMNMFYLCLIITKCANTWDEQDVQFEKNLHKVFRYKSVAFSKLKMQIFFTLFFKWWWRKLEINTVIIHAQRFSLPSFSFR